LPRLFLLGLLAWLAIAPRQKAQTAEPTVGGASDNEATKQKILALDQELNKAAVQGNLRFFAAVMPDDYVGVAPNGMILEKSMIAAHYQAATLHYESVTDSDVQIRLHGDGQCAILTALATVKGQDGDTDLSGTYRILRVFLRHDADWQIVAFQATPMRSPIAN
jgi:ketosteroid isomerase-like protein